MTERFLVTGSMGCIGAWTLRHLVRSGVEVIATDLATDRRRPSLVMSDVELGEVTWRQLDVTDGAAVRSLIDDQAVTHVVHLAGLQIPFCRADPSLGAAVNVVGTVNVFEAVRHSGVRGVSYASSIGALGPPQDYPEGSVDDDVALTPQTLYGVYKGANEATARIYWQDWQVGSVGLRPHTVFGVGRDQGLTSDLAKALLAAAAGEPFTIRFSGQVAVQHASDVARIFIEAARAEYSGAPVCLLRGDVLDVRDFVAAIHAVKPDAAVTVVEGSPLPFPADCDDARLRGVIGNPSYTMLADAIAADIGHYEELLAGGRIDLAQLSE